jgi:dienelactone hydrolase
MTIKDTEHVDLATPAGPMRTYIFRPAASGKYPGILLFSEIFQVTGPIRRTAALLAGHGFVVAVPEIYHEFEPAGTVLAYDQAGADRGNALKTTMIYGRQDPHVPGEGCAKVYAALTEAGVHFTWHEFNGAHAFLRDEGYRHDPELAHLCYRMAIDFFRRKLGEGDLRDANGASGPAETKH